MKYRDELIGLLLGLTIVAAFAALIAGLLSMMA
jgi:hypothetical protein